MNRIILACLAAVSFMSMNGNARAQVKAVPSSAVMKAPSPAEVMFKAWDLDHNGSLSQAEFRSGWQQIRRATQLQVRLREQFTAVDLNKSGAIEANEYAGLLLVKQAGKSAPLLATFDGNRDGKLQWDEYLKFVGALAPQNERKGTSR